jgi:hypothetical protein
MDIGTGVAIGASSFAICGAGCSLIKSFYGKNGNGNGNKNGESKVCLEHSGVCQAIDDINKNIDEIKKDVKTLLERRTQARD